MIYCCHSHNRPYMHNRCEIWLKNLVSPSFAGWFFVLFHFVFFLPFAIEASKATGIRVRFMSCFTLFYFRIIGLFTSAHSDVRWLGNKSEESGFRGRNSHHHYYQLSSSSPMSKFCCSHAIDIFHKFYFRMGKPNQKTGCKWISCDWIEFVVKLRSSKKNALKNDRFFFVQNIWIENKNKSTSIHACRFVLIITKATQVIGRRMWKQ